MRDVCCVAAIKPIYGRSGSGRVCLNFRLDKMSGMSEDVLQQNSGSVSRAHDEYIFVCEVLYVCVCMHAHVCGCVHE